MVPITFRKVCCCFQANSPCLRPFFSHSVHSALASLLALAYAKLFCAPGAYIYFSLLSFSTYFPHQCLFIPEFQIAPMNFLHISNSFQFHSCPLAHFEIISCVCLFLPLWTGGSIRAETTCLIHHLSPITFYSISQTEGVHILLADSSDPCSSSHLHHLLLSDFSHFIL